MRAVAGLVAEAAYGLIAVIQCLKVDRFAKKFKFAGRRLAYDHKHRHVDKDVPYEFQDAQQLLSDFFAEVDRVLQEIRHR